MFIFDNCHARVCLLLVFLEGQLMRRINLLEEAIFKLSILFLLNLGLLMFQLMIHDLLGILFCRGTRKELRLRHARGVYQRSLLLVGDLSLVFVLRLGNRKNDVLSIAHHSSTSLRVHSIRSG